MKKFFLLMAFSLNLTTLAMASVASTSEETIPQANAAKIPSGIEFDKIVYDILSQKQMTFSDLETQLKSILDDTSYTKYSEKQDKLITTTILGKIVAHPGALSYILRPASQLVIRNDIADTDSQYEIRLYNCLDAQRLKGCVHMDKIELWREHLGQKEFYETGATPPLVAKHMPLISSSPDVGMLSILDTYPGDIYSIRNTLYHWEFKDFLLSNSKKTPSFEKEPRFIVTPNATGDHATTLINVLEGRRVILTLFLNTLLGTQETQGEFGTELMKRFNLANSYSFLGNSEALSKLSVAEQTHKNITVSPDFSYPSVTINRTTPYVDVSHSIQVQEGDLNCVLYANNFSNAVSTMLGDKDIADTVYTLSQQVSAHPEDLGSTKSLKELFQVRLKKFLPQYYDAQGNVKSPAELKKYHMDLRWEISGKSIQSFIKRAQASKTS